jgi:Putative zinc-finger
VAERHRRERAVEHMLRRGTGAPTSAATSPACVDGETLAAWSSGALSAGEAARLEEHFADCARCQSMLAAFMQSEPIRPAPAAWWQRAHLRWLVPLATAATVAAIWVATPQRVEPPHAEEQRHAFQAPRDEGRSVAPQPPPAAGARTSAPSPPSAQARQEARPTPEKKLEAPPRHADAADTRAKEEARNQESDRLAAAAPSPAPPAAAPPPAAAAEAPAKPAESVTATTDTGQRLARFAIPEIVSPDAATRWRIFGGQVQRLATSGERWEPAALPSATIAAGHAPAASVAWFVGKAGAIFVTADGSRFEQIPFISSADLVSVVALDDRRATVTTADGRRFHTENRGDAWLER